MRLSATIIMLWYASTIHTLTLNKVDNSVLLAFTKTHPISFPSAYGNIEIILQLDTFLDEIATLKQNINLMSTQCTYELNSTECNSFEIFMTHHIEELEEKEQELRHIKTNGREKRFDPTIILSPFAIYLQFGAESSTELEHMKITNETLIVQSKIVQSIAEINHKILTLEKQDRQLKIQNSLHAAIISVTEYTRVMNDIYEILINKNSNKILNIAHHANISKAIKKMKNELLTDEGFFSDTTVGILKTADVGIQFVNKNIHILVRIPISYKRQALDGFKIRPIPFFNEGGELMLINTHFDFIAYNNDNNETYGLLEAEIGKCKEVNELYICPNKHRQPKNCEIGIFNNQTIRNCQFTYLPANSTSIQLNEDTFYCITKNRIEISIYCDNDMKIYVNQSVSFSAPPNCLIIIGNDTYSTNIYNYKVSTIIFPISLPKPVNISKNATYSNNNSTREILKQINKLGNLTTALYNKRKIDFPLVPDLTISDYLFSLPAKIVLGIILLCIFPTLIKIICTRFSKLLP